MIPIAYFATVILSLSHLYGNGNVTIGSFAIAKRILSQLYDNGNQELANRTIYCDCRFQDKLIELTRCDFSPIHAKTVMTVEWEHIVPAATLGRKFPTWNHRYNFPSCRRLSNRKCTEKIYQLYRFMSADMYKKHELCSRKRKMNSAT